jgi:hypothetical protein
MQRLDRLCSSCGGPLIQVAAVAVVLAGQGLMFEVSFRNEV